jgi:hypothetical protein
MDETRGKQGAGGAWAVLAVLAVALIFALFKFGKNKETIYNQQINTNSSITREQVLEELKGEQDSELWGKYIEKIFSESKTPSQDLSAEYQRELEQKVTLPEETIFLQGKIVGNSYNERVKYLNEFEQLFVSSKKKGVFDEAKMFANQAGDNGKILELSDYDKETILRLATEYELWGKEILQLDTPAQYEKKSLGAVRDILQISYILKKVVTETDSQVYPMWIGKYTEKVFDILANRYVK